MSNEPECIHLESPKLQLIAVVAAYCIFASIFGLAHKYDINPDIIAYLRLAGYIAEGSWQQSVTGYWAPLLTWCLAPFLFFGLDGVVAARIVVALGGLGTVFSIWLLSRRFIASEGTRFIVVLISTLLISNWTVHNPGLNPDLILAALLMCYFYFAASPHLLNNQKTAFLCGVVGGFAYLTKHYAFPFFLAHFPLVLLLRGYIDKGTGKVSGKIAISFIAGLAGLLIISLPWILLISSKHDRLLISTSGKLNHALLGPENKIKSNYGNPGFHGLHKPDNSYAIHIWEDPAQIEKEYTTWSPFENKAYFIYQVKIWKKNLNDTLNYLILKSPFFLYFSSIGIIVLSAIAFLISNRTNEKIFLYCFTLTILFIYPLGYILVNAANARYFYPVMLISLLISFHFFEELKTSFIFSKEKGKPNFRKKILLYYILAVFVSAVTLKPAMNLFYSFRHIVTTKESNQSEKIVDQLKSTDFPAPYATIGSVESIFRDIHIAYYLEKQFLGQVISSDPEEIARELKDAGAESLIVFDNLEIVNKLRNDGRYIHKTTVEKNKAAGINKEINIFSIKILHNN